MCRLQAAGGPARLRLVTHLRLRRPLRTAAQLDAHALRRLRHRLLAPRPLDPPFRRHSRAAPRHHRQQARARRAPPEHGARTADAPKRAPQAFCPLLTVRASLPPPHTCKPCQTRADQPRVGGPPRLARPGAAAGGAARAAGGAGRPRGGGAAQRDRPDAGGVEVRRRDRRADARRQVPRRGGVGRAAAARGVRQRERGALQLLARRRRARRHVPGAGKGGRRQGVPELPHRRGQRRRRPRQGARRSCPIAALSAV